MDEEEVQMIGDSRVRTQALLSPKGILVGIGRD